jgi:hypothetical protein
MHNITREGIQSAVSSIQLHVKYTAEEVQDTRSAFSGYRTICR